ncbi:MAG: twin-arginine translocase TatA/TatE family subunit [Archangium sp.]|nr:twin-arginine translocase TatA/TatE family subunit [Archangium sp.]
MSCLGTGELLTLACVAVIVFSASRMGQLGNAIGRFMYSFRRASKGDDVIDVTPTRTIDAPRPDSVDRTGH